jgi:hypothetical protein
VPEHSITSANSSAGPLQRLLKQHGCIKIKVCLNT